MNAITGWGKEVCDAWNRFWFTAQGGKTLGLIRLLTGMIVFYTHLVWSPLLVQFLGPDGMVPENYRSDFFESRWAWSHFDWLPTETSIWIVHVLTLVVMLLFALGFWTRFTGIATAFFVISYANRATAVLFGLDQIMAFLTLYLAISDCGGHFSLARRINVGAKEVVASIRNNIAIRLMQIHLCVVYLFAGLGKCQGETWWNGEAIWGAAASYEYQTVDMTWLADHMWLVSIITLVTLIFEIGYVGLIWPKLTRPLMLMIAVPLHLGIGLCMGMMEFGVIMLVANLAFVEFPAESEP